MKKKTGVNIQKIQVHIGQLKQEKQQYEALCCERKYFVDEVKVSLDFLGRDDISAEQIIGQLKCVHEMSEELLGNAELVKVDEETRLQNRIDEIKEKQISFKQNLEGKKEGLRESQRKLIEIKKYLQEVSVLDLQAKQFSSAIEEITHNIYSLNENFKEDNVQAQISADTNQLSKMEQGLASLEQDRKRAQKNSVLLEKIEHEKKNVDRKQLEINKFTIKHSQNFEKLFNTRKYPSQLKKLINEIYKKAESDIEILQNTINKKTKLNN